MKSVTLLAFAGPGGGAAVILLCKGLELQGGTLAVNAPEGAGLQVWEGTQADDGKLGGGWRRATQRDMEEFGAPLCEPTASVGWCCKMREKFLIQIPYNDVSVPMPTEFADFVIEWEPITIGIKYCPFCGGRMDGSQIQRVTKQGEG